MSTLAMPERGIRPSVDVSVRFPVVDIDVTAEGLLERLNNYLPSADILHEIANPTSIDLARREDYRRKYPRCDYAAVYYQGRMVFVPAWHPINSVPSIFHGADYGTRVFEGGSAEPVIDNGRLIGANIILLGPKMTRMFGRSLPTRDLQFLQPPQVYAQALVDLVAAHGSPLYMGDKGLRRAYIRPIVSPSHGAGLGVGIPPEAPVDAVIEAFYWPFYLTRDPKDAYEGKGAIAQALAAQRLLPSEGKHSSSYGPVAPLTRRAKLLGGDEAILFAPFTSVGGNRGQTVNLQQDYILEERDVVDILLDLSLADGPGEEIAVVNETTGELWVLPMRVNRLGGTTLEHVQKYIAPQAGLTVRERTFSLRELQEAQKEGNKICLIFVGNAIRVCPIGRVDIRDEKYHLRETLTFDIPEAVRRIQYLYESQVAGQIDSGNPELLTLINLVDGNMAREYLDRIFAAWFEPEYLEQIRQATS